MARFLAILVIGIVAYIIFAMFRQQLKKAYKPRVDSATDSASDTVSFSVSGRTEEQLQDVIHRFLDETDIEGAFIQSSSGSGTRFTVTMPKNVKAPFQQFMSKQ